SRPGRVRAFLDYSVRSSEDERRRPLADCVVTVMIEHEQPNGGGEIPLVTPAINVGDHIRQRLMTPRGNFLHAFPEGILETDAGLVPGYYDRAFDDRRFHRPSSLLARFVSRQGSRVAVHLSHAPFAARVTYSPHGNMPSANAARPRVTGRPDDAPSVRAWFE